MLYMVNIAFVEVYLLQYLPRFSQVREMTTSDMKPTLNFSNRTQFTPASLVCVPDPNSK